VPHIETQPISHFTVEQFREWLAAGAMRMCGCEEGMASAFAPIAEQVGHSRKLTWVEELAWIALMLDGDARRRFVSGLNEALVLLARKLASDNWTAIHNLIDLMRQVDASERIMGLAAVGTRLEDDVHPLDCGIRRKLTASVILAATEARGHERIESCGLALRMARLLLELNPNLSALQRIALMRRLVRIDVDSMELDSLGLDANSESAIRDAKYRSLFRFGHVHE
jgi:hypothetical protein